VRLQPRWRFVPVRTPTVKGDARSPWSNAYDPPLEDGVRPSDKLRKIEMAANDAFDVYRDL
jgi:hypothetical protein